MTSNLKIGLRKLFFSLFLLTFTAAFPPATDFQALYWLNFEMISRIKKEYLWKIPIKSSSKLVFSCKSVKEVRVDDLLRKSGLFTPKELDMILGNMYNEFVQYSDEVKNMREQGNSIDDEIDWSKAKFWKIIYLLSFLNTFQVYDSIEFLFVETVCLSSFLLVRRFVFCYIEALVIFHWL